MAMARVAAANQLGVLEYCQSKGSVGADAVAAQKDVMIRMPAASADTTTAEGQGKNGTLASPNGQTMTLDSVASAQHTTVPALCKQLGASAIQASMSFKQSGSTMPGSGMKMPAMPGGMPAMPGGMQMPAMPSMPK